ncbi:hypothetical protein EC991_009757 [Linnemannia zychae]|nr:hypothetical protein EC991_009757 [Linnemannia zychae]
MSPTPTPAITAVKSEQSSPVLSTKTDATPVAAPIIPSSSQKSSRRGRTKGGPVDPSVNTTPIPTHTTQFASHVPQPIHPLPASLGGMTPSTTTTPLESTKNPFESTTPTPQQHQFQHSVVLPSQQQHFEKYPSQQQHYHHSLATPTSATVPTPPLPLPSSHHQYLQQQQQPAEFNGSSHGTGLGLGLGLNLGYYDFMTPMPMPPSSASASTPSSSSSPPTPASAHIVTSAATRQSPVTTSSPVPKTSLIGGNGVSNGVGLYSNGSVLQNNDSSSSASSPSMLDLTGMASGLVDTVVVASQNPTTNGSLKRNSSHLVSTNAGSNKLFTSRGSYSSSSQGNSSVQTSPDIDAAHSAPLPSSNRFDRRHHHPHDGLLQEVDMDFEHDDQTNTSTVNGDDEQDRDDEDDDEDDPENNSPAICPHCLKEFQSKGLLRSHIVSHSSDRPFVCRDCSDKSYKRNHDLLRHRREKHNVEGAVIPPRGSGRHSHSGVSGGAKRGSGITMGLGGGDLAMMGGLGFTGGAGGVRNRSHRRSCSSAILGSGLGTRSTTTSSPFQHQGMARGLPDGYPTAVTVISQNPHQQQQQSKMPSPHDLMFASPAAAGMMFLNTTLAANGSSSGPSGANGLDFPHLASLGGSAPPTPTFTLPSQKQQLHHQQQPFGHQFQTPMHQQQLYHMQGRRPPPPPLPQQLQQHHQIHPLQQHPLSMQHALLQQQSQQHQRAASQQHLNMNLGISLGLSLEMSDFGISSMAASTAMDQQRRASSASDRNSISSQGGISCSTSTPSLSSTYSTTPSSSVSFASQASSSSPSSEMMSSGIPMLASQ